MMETGSAPIVSHETIIHGSDPIVVVPIKFTVYARETLIEDRVHKLMSLAHPEYDWFIICELDRDDPDYQAAALNALRGVFWTGHIGGMEDYHPLLNSVRGAVFNCLAELYPLAVFPDLED